MDISSAIFDPELGCTAFTVERISQMVLPAARYVCLSGTAHWDQTAFP